MAFARKHTGGWCVTVGGLAVALLEQPVSVAYAKRRFFLETTFLVGKSVFFFNLANRRQFCTPGLGRYIYTYLLDV